TPEDLRKFVDENAQTVKEEDVRAFVEENYQAGGRKNVTGEEVQRIKDLIAQQGSLEFRIAANAHRDGAAFRAAEEFFKNKDNEARRKEELERAAKAGLPPPPPTPPEGDTWEFTYSWVEIGKKERAQLGLNNASKGGQRWE